MPPRFFITHSWNDIDFAERFANDLRARGLDGFFDKYSLSPGDIVSAEIQRGLERCDFYTPILSYAALKSPWCEEEINAAITLGKLPGRNGRPRIIPILVEDCRDQMERFNFLLARLYVIFEKRYDEAFQEFWRGVMAAPTTDSPFVFDSPPTSSPPPLTKPAPTLPLDPQPVSLPTETVSQVRSSPPPAAPVTTPAQLPRDELVRLYNEGRALQNGDDLAGARAAFERIFAAAPDYRDVASRLEKLDLYLNASALMEQSLADADDRPEFWEQAAARLQELGQLDANFLDAQTKLQIARRWLALPELYEKLLDALDADDWAAAFPLFQQIRAVKPNYLKTQLLFERAWGELVRAGLTHKKNERDGKVMVLVPAGEFLMGSTDKDKDAQANEKPQHTVYLDEFYISRYPVTNAEYKKFKTDWTIPNGKENHPVVNVNWNDAAAYCEWAGGRLPTEVEWEKAASWDDAKKIKRVYPWGDTFDKNKCNSSESGIGDTTPVGKYSPHGDSSCGAGDMAGNVWEWCADWFDENYYKGSPRENPRGPASGTYRVLRGGAWFDVQDLARCAFRVRNDPGYRGGSVGFRVAVSPV
ncbi:TIR domain-containing protein [Anaerolineae bacterium CFX7]|nr:TIR domain-containing protein [Anaerolineae bacterium CFX7]